MKLITSKQLEQLGFTQFRLESIVTKFSWRPPFIINITKYDDMRMGYRLGNLEIILESSYNSRDLFTYMRVGNQGSIRIDVTYELVRELLISLRLVPAACKNCLRVTNNIPFCTLYCKMDYDQKIKDEKLSRKTNKDSK